MLTVSGARSHRRPRGVRRCRSPVAWPSRPRTRLRDRLGGLACGGALQT